MLKRTLSLILVLSIILALFLPGTAFAEDRVVLTIGDVEDRSGSRMDGDDQLGLWQYLEDQLNVEIQFVYLTPEAYATGLSSGNLPDIVATKNNLATILENGVAFNADPDGSPEEILSAVGQAVDAFVGEAEQFDDLTMMCLEYKGADGSPVTSGQDQK